jgi:flavin-dependent dehydrogenase
MAEMPVLIVGAGPAGLTLAIDLAWRGNAEPADPLALIDRLEGVRGR